jgi:hypothetical protein
VINLLQSLKRTLHGRQRHFSTQSVKLNITMSSVLGSVSNGSKFVGWFRVCFQPVTELFQQVSTQNSLLKSQHCLLQLSIRVLIVSQHDQDVYWAVLVALSPPAFRFAIWQVFVESRSNTRQFPINSAIISQPVKEYQLDWKLECRRSKSG